MSKKRIISFPHHFTVGILDRFSHASHLLVTELRINGQGNLATVILVCLRIILNPVTQAFEKEYQKPFNLYDYVQNQKLKWHSPTDLALLREFFITHLPDGYFGPWTSSLDDYCYDNSCEDCIAKFYTINGFYKVNESSFYMDKDQIWLAFVSANLEEPEDEAIIVFAPLGKNIEDIPPAIKTFTNNLSKSNLYAEGIKLKHFQTKPQWLYKLKSWFE